MKPSLATFQQQMGFPDGAAGKESAYSAGDSGDEGLIPGSKRSFQGGKWQNPLWYFCLKNPTKRRVWPDTVHSVTESDPVERLTHTCIQPQIKSGVGAIC